MIRLDALPRSIAILATLLACSKPSDPEIHPDSKWQPSTGDVPIVVEPAIDGAAPIELRFGWAPNRFEVTEKVIKEGRNAEMKYTLEVTAVDGGLAIAYRDLRFTAFEDYDLENPLVRAQFAEAERATAMMQPGFRVGADGVFAGLLDAESIVRGFEALPGDNDAAAFRKLIENPQWRSLLEAAVAKPWQAWVEVWVGFDAAPGQVVEGDVEFDFVGTPLLQHVRQEYQGRDPVRPGHVRLRYEQHVDDPRIMGMVGEMSSSLVDDPEKLDEIRKAAKETEDDVIFDQRRVIEISLDSRTLVPAWVKDVTTVTVRGREPGVVEDVKQFESHEWTFELVRD